MVIIVFMVFMVYHNKKPRLKHSMIIRIIIVLLRTSKLILIGYHAIIKYLGNESQKTFYID